MKALVYGGMRDINVAEVEDPKIVKADDIVHDLRYKLIIVK